MPFFVSFRGSHFVSPVSDLIYKDTPEIRHEATGVIRAGGIIAFRTDTLYGLGADPLNAKAVNKIKELKGREEGKPILLLISDMDHVDRFVARAASFKEVATRYWPAPLTLIGHARPDLPFDLTAGSGSIGLRLPDDESVRALVRMCGGALTATSANVSGTEPASSAQEVRKYFSSGIDLIIDSGAATSTEASTVMDISGEKPKLIREGAIKRENLIGLM